MRSVLALSLATVSAGASACLWDRDTLETDYHRFPTTLEALTGRFDREPAEFYQLRLKRVQREIAANPNQPDLYDDAAVAESRLGRQDAAVAWMDRKAKLRLSDDQRYRLYSNRGTFRLVKWMAGDHRALLPTLDAAIRDIETGLKINPHAHFDREPVQLEFMRWAKDFTKADKGEYDPALKPLWVRRESALANDLIVRGVTGMIVMGYAWESPDLMGWLAVAARKDDRKGIAHYAILRFEELRAHRVAAIDQGAHPLVGSMIDADEVDGEYARLRREGDAYVAERQAYERKRFAQGRHPDVDPQFWSEWTPRPFGLDLAAARRRQWKGWTFDTALPILIVTAIFASIVAIVVILFARARASRRAS